MKLSLLSAVALPVVVVSAHGIDARHANVVRQANNAAAASSPAPAASSPAPAGSSAAAPPPAVSSAAAPPPAGSSAAAPPAGTPPPTASFSLASINPTAVPLSDIISGTITTQATLGVSTTYAPGTTPTFLPNAPLLPNAAALVPANYPALDKAPPTDSPEVQQWIAEVKASGIDIPDIAPTVAGGCAANAQAAADTSRCWWTCGGCVRDTDITTCPDKLTWGLTYDDGPAPYTPDLLQYLDANNLKTTFFVVGSRAISYPALLQEEYMDQHQIAVHTWSHPSMTTVSTEGVIAELGWSKKIIKDVLGVTPVYWRPPYGDIDDRVRAIGLAMGLTPIMWTRISPEATFDTNDYNVAGGLVSASQVLQNWEEIIGNATTIDTGFIVLEHDLFAQTVDLATGYILPAALANQPKFDIKPVISCLNKPLSDAYLETNDNKTNPLPTGTASNPAPVAFSSGAPGSAAATGGANNTSSGSTSGSGSAQKGAAAPLAVSNALLVAGSALAAAFAGFSILL